MIFDKLGIISTEKYRRLESLLDKAHKTGSIRSKKIKKIASAIETLVHEHGEVNVIFVCTHNSRRSQACELWAHTFIHHFGLKGVKVYSAGTEKTKFNYRMADAARRWGFRVGVHRDTSEEVYSIASPYNKDDARSYTSKVLDDKTLPRENVVAIMTCDHADQNCPSVPGAVARFSLNYKDPSTYDGDPAETSLYDVVFKKIGMEMGVLFANID